VFAQDDTGAYDGSQIAMDTEQGRAFAAYVGKLGAEGVLKSTVSGDIAKEAFLQGKAPYMITGPWNVGDFVDAGLDVSIEAIPSAGGGESQPFVGVQGFFISAKSENALLANEFVVNYLGTEDVQLELYEAGGRAPALSAAVDKIADDPVVAGFAEVGKNGVPMPSIPAMDSVWTDWGATQLAIINQQGDPGELWTQMCASIASKIAAA
jgi:arabinogalactan oligomer/maltooligosaccharide transport system substrate-binding protein